MSPDNGRPIHYQPEPPRPPITTSYRISDERRYSPNALERQLNAELHLLDGVEASMIQVENMERLRSVALSQQEVVSLAQVLRNVKFYYLISLIHTFFYYSNLQQILFLNNKHESK